MKKLAALLLALALPFAAAQAQTYTAGDYYTVDFPDTLTLDDTSYTADNTEDYHWLFLLDGGDYLIDASLSPADGFEGFTLSTASDAEKQNYLQTTLEDFTDQSATLAGTLTADSGIPFYIYSMLDSDGPYYFAETISAGTSVSFCCYYTDASATPDSALMQKLQTVLKTFNPTTQGTGKV